MASAEIRAAPEKDIHADIFRNGDRWTAAGDSITQGGAYCAWIYLFYATRFPEMKIDVSNAGNSGDSADGGLIRYDWDIRPHKPTVATIMFGMNDVRRELYGDIQDTAELAARRTEALQKYRRNMTALASRLKADGTRIIFVTPSPYDENMKCKTQSLSGVNWALAECGTFMRKLAADIGGSVIDLNGPMTALNAKMQASNPESSLIKQDRVHPSEVGHFAMAYFFLKGQHVPGIVSSLTVDATASRVTESINATVEKLLVGDKGVSFTMTAKALPYPVGKELEPALALVPFQDELNREILKVSGLSAGDYQMLIDGKEVRRYSADALSKGVNLSLEKNTPQMLQSACVLELMRQWHKLMSGEVRLIANFEFWRLGDVPHPISLDAVRPRLEQEMRKLKDSSIESDRWALDWYMRYMETKPNEAQDLAKLADLAEQIRLAARPQPHSYQLQPASK
jgi:lysophospholipase L1-like esterase